MGTATTRPGHPDERQIYCIIYAHSIPERSVVFVGVEASSMSKYQCTICGYVYDPAVGDPDSGIAPGTSFDELPNDWVCPICGADKDAFEKL